MLKLFSHLSIKTVHFIGIMSALLLSSIVIFMFIKEERGLQAQFYSEQKGFVEQHAMLTRKLNLLHAALAPDLQLNYTTSWQNDVASSLASYKLSLNSSSSELHADGVLHTLRLSGNLHDFLQLSSDLLRKHPLADISMLVISPNQDLTLNYTLHVKEKDGAK